MAESKREAFVRLAESRTNTVLDKIRVLGNLSNSYAYDYTPEDVQRIFKAIEAELRATRIKFGQQSKRQFTLKQ